MSNRAAQPEAGSGSRPVTPPSIIFALALFALAIVLVVRFSVWEPEPAQDSWQVLRDGIDWILEIGAAVLGGIICTVVGARRSPRSRWTKAAVALSVSSVLGILGLLSSA
jgi:hypothetical protein